ncbi:MAG: glycosyltransferase family 2 protein [bacterium]|nr:glycosyltransferase family 2 protein [bacterium]
MTYKGKKVFVVMPAFNAEKTLEKTFLDLPGGMFDSVILVDDASADKTVQVAERLRLTVVKHDKNRGYGGNQKTCYQTALKMGADIMVMVHPDHQYDPKFIPELIEPIVNGEYSAVFGSRLAVRKNALAGGMPKWKFIFNIILTRIGNFFLGTALTEFHSGFRAYGKEVFKQIDIERNSDNFVFDTQIIVQLTDKKIAIKEIPITTRYFKEASQIGLGPSIVYGLGILYNIFLYKLKLKKF